MKNRFACLLLACVACNLAAPSSLHAQAEKVKERAKDLKKKVESGETTQTNKPPAKTPPPAPPALPAPPAPRK